jgi:hypothetical protein
LYVCCSINPLALGLSLIYNNEISVSRCRNLRKLKYRINSLSKGTWRPMRY